MKASFGYYIDSFKGFSRQVWLLALITFINRAGTMVVPFLSLYLTKDLNFSLEQVGWIMSCFGLGSVLGSWIGGKMSDRIGFYTTMLGSLSVSGFLLVGLQLLQTFQGFCVGIFVLMTISDAFRPAMFVAIRHYSKPENRTRSVSLIRLAINLGFSIGPALGGLLIFNFGYDGLFWFDGITCILAAILLKGSVSGKTRSSVHERNEVGRSGSPFRDRPFLLATLATLLVCIAFFQFFSTVPLYYKEIHQLNEKQIGWLLGMNGLLIFLVEMPLIRFIEQRKSNIFNALAGSTFLILLSFFAFIISPWSGILVISMALMTFGEMINFPMMNRFTMGRAGSSNMGAYMAVYSMSFGMAHILGHNAGLQLIGAFGYNITWGVMCTFLALSMFIFIRLKSKVTLDTEE